MSECKRFVGTWVHHYGFDFEFYECINCGSGPYGHKVRNENSN